MALHDDTLYGCLYFRPAAEHNKGDMLEIYDWDTGKYLGEIPQVNYTYNVVGNMNEYQVTIGETTFGGIANLSTQTEAVMDYGNLMWVTLQRVTNARDAIHMMGELVSKYGYYSQGESFSVGDKNEVWHMELIGKGEYELGAVWVARKVPDGLIGAHANSARITTFPLNDSDTCIYSSDVITFAQKYGFYKGKPEDFSFADVYDDLGPSNARWDMARVWDFFNHNTDMSEYLDFAQGRNMSNRMPLFIKPDNKVGLADLMKWIRSHYNGTFFQMTEDWDWGNQPFRAPYRWRPLDWESGGKYYLNDRAISTQQTGWTFIAEMRSFLPDAIGGRQFFGVDDTSCTVYSPYYCSITKIPWALDESNGAIMDFTFDSMFWIMNMVATFAYSRWEYIYPDVRAKINELEAQYIKDADTADQIALEMYKSGKDPTQYLTDFSVNTGNGLHANWTTFFGKIFSKFLDGDIRVPVEGNPFPKIIQPGYDQAWYDQIAATSGDHFLIPDQGKGHDVGGGKLRRRRTTKGT